MAVEWIKTHRAMAEAGEGLTLAITVKEDSDLVGAISLGVNATFARAELGYWIGEPYWGRGYCTEAATTLVRFAFEELDLHRVHASYLARNPASGRLLQKIGMSKEGVARQHTRKWGVFEDLVLCGMLRSERPGAKV
jgi:RimJ/RimL family protein N-acetyltransferase